MSTHLKQDRREKRLTAAVLARTLRGPPTASAVHDGGGLYMDNRSPPREPGELRVGYWYYRHSAVEGGKRRNVSISIGPTNEISLADARARRDEIRRQIREGINPRERREEEKQKREKKSHPAFSLAAIWDSYINTKKAAHHSKGGIDTYTRYWLRDVAPAIGDKDVREISRTDVVSVIRPHWQRSYGTLFRWFVWSLIDFAAAEWEGKIAIRNPAELRSIKTLLGPRSHKTQHRSALPWQDVPAYMARLRAVPDRKARAAEVTILEAKRSDEICSARYSQIDWQAETIEIRATPRKGGRYLHPLTQRTMEILRQCAIEDGIDPTLRQRDSGFKDAPIFFKKGKAVDGGSGNRNMATFIRSVTPKDGQEQDFTLHGFRSAFRRWGRQKHPDDILELCLGHRVVGAVVGAYLRYDDPNDTELFQEKRKAMEDWSQFCCSAELPSGELVIRNTKAAMAYLSATDDWPLVDKMRQMVQAGEVSSVRQAAWRMAPSAKSLKGNTNRDSKARRLIGRYKEAFGYVGRNARVHYQAYQPSEFPLGHPANSTNFAHTDPVNLGCKRTPGTCTVKEAAAALGVTRSELHHACLRGKIRATKTENGLYEIPVAELRRAYPDLSLPELSDAAD